MIHPVHTLGYFGVNEQAMIKAECFSEVYIRRKAKELHANDPLLLEKSIHAFVLLGHLADSGIPFVFKGGTCAMLLLDPIRRLSIDVDIQCGEHRHIVDAVDLERLRAISVTHDPWRCLNRLLAVNPEAFHYWHCAEQFIARIAESDTSSAES